MKINMGNIDRIIRIIAALIIGYLYFTDVLTGTLGIVLLVLAGIFVITASTSRCPLYLPFGLSTCPAHEEAAKE